jgi:hypothetical protein
MKRVNVLCEGPTEERFVQRILYPFFLTKNILLTPRSLDGGFNYERLKHEIIQWLNQDHSAFVTTMIDLYGLKGKYPGLIEFRGETPHERVIEMENAMKLDVLSSPKVHNINFIPYFQLHEYEALLFSNPEKLEEWLKLDNYIPSNHFSNIREEFESPEHINDSPQTAPSKRILSIAKSYNKVADGSMIASDIGLINIRQECPHFNDWLVKLENLS